MSSFAHYFNKHIAKKNELDDITIIDYYSPEYNRMHNLRYIFDKKNSSLAITGDFGELVAVNFNNMGDWEDFYETLESAGKKVSEIVLLYLDAYKRAYESIKNEEVE